ncbi:MAG: hypothetical protein ACHP84_08535 [Caulobacterales bacterium]
MLSTDPKRYLEQRPLFTHGDRGRLQVIAGGIDAPIAEFGIETAFPQFDRLPDGRWIVADSRCARSGQNAAVIDPAGVITHRFRLGDGIEHLQCDGAGAIWVGYFDEGLSDDLGCAGLARFDDEGAAAWSYNHEVARRFAAYPAEHYVDDNYALNVSGSEVWACSYMSFEILRVLPDGEWRTWSNDVKGAKAIAVDGRDVVLFGGYEPNEMRIAHVRLGRDHAEWLGVLELNLDGDVDARNRTVVGRGDTVHVVTTSTWSKFSVAEVVAAMQAAGSATVPNPEEPFDHTTTYIIGPSRD